MAAMRRLTSREQKVIIAGKRGCSQSREQRTLERSAVLGQSPDGQARDEECLTIVPGFWVGRLLVRQFRYCRFHEADIS
jgi:hypothetical protein